MSRWSDGDAGKRYWLFVRVSKAVVGLICAMGAYVSTTSASPSWEIVVGLAVVAGLMFDAPSVTRFTELVIGAIPWTPSRPSEIELPGGTPRAAEDSEGGEETDGDAS